MNSSFSADAINNHSVEKQLFHSLYVQNQKMLYEYALGFTKSQEISADIVQNIFLKLWLNKGALSGIDNFQGYLFRMAYNECISYLRKEQCRNKNLRSFSGRREQAICAYALLDQRELKKFFQQAIHSLSPQQKKVYVLYTMEQWSIERISFFLGITIQTAKEHMKQAKRKVRSYVGERIGFEEKPKKLRVTRGFVTAKFKKTNKKWNVAA